MADTQKTVKERAIEIARGLIDNEFKSDDPLLAEVCTRLAPFKPLLVKYGKDKALEVLGSMGSLVGNDEKDPVSLLKKAIDKLELMKRFL